MKEAALMCMTLTDQDRTLIHFFRGEMIGVLLDVEPHLIDEQEGVIVVSCSDGDQMADVFEHHEDVCRCHRKNPRIHLFALNGGAKLIPHDSPLLLCQEDKALIEHIRMAKDLKGIKTVVLYVHAPCGAAYSKKLTLWDILELLFKGKTRVKEEIPGVKVACFCHIDYGGGRKRTYFVSREAWNKWRASVETKTQQEECV